MSKITRSTLLEKKKQGVPITVLTAYDYTFAKLLSSFGIDVLLVGDSMGMVMYGHRDTLPVTLTEMVEHTEAVRRGAGDAFVVSDMPFLSYQINEEEAVRNAGELLRHGAEAVKLEGGTSICPTIRRMVSAGIPVMGHLGLTPQAIHQLGGYKVQGKSEESAKTLLEDAKALENAGCFSIVLECMPAKLAETITKTIAIPTVGIGAGNACDGQVLVLQDCLGLTTDIHPKFVKNFGNVRVEVEKAVRQYIEEVKTRTFPDAEHSY